MEQFGNRMDFFKKTTEETPEECISRAVNDPTPFGRLDLQLWEVGRARNQNHWAQRPFMEDPYFRCYYIAEGRGKLRTLDGSFPLEPGGLYLIPANYLFAYELDGPPPAHYWLHFSSELLDKLPGCREPAGTPADVSEEMERLLELASAPATPAAAQEMDLLMRRLLAPLLLKVTENWNGEFHSGAFADSIDYIKRNFRHDIAIPELAARAGTGPRQLFPRLPAGGRHVAEIVPYPDPHQPCPDAAAENRHDRPRNRPRSRLSRRVLLLPPLPEARRHDPDRLPRTQQRPALTTAGRIVGPNSGSALAFAPDRRYVIAATEGWCMQKKEESGSVKSVLKALGALDFVLEQSMTRPGVGSPRSPRRWRSGRPRRGIS